MKTRAELRRFWTRLLNDLEEGRPISNARADQAIQLASAWST